MTKDRYAAAWAQVGERHKGRRIGTLWLSEAGMSGDATLTVDFLDKPGLDRADVLLDCIGVLDREYRLAVGSIFDHTRAEIETP